MSGRVAVVVFQLGGPDSLEAIEPFLVNLFSDPDIINFPGAFLARRPLARFIASRRSKKVAHHYEQIGGKSPIVDLTLAQAQALRLELNTHLPADVFVAMRYWKPTTEEVIDRIRDGDYSKVVLLPLYPQFSKATTVSSLKEWHKQAKLRGLHGVAIETVCCYYYHPLYIQAIVDNINRTLVRFANVAPSEIDIVFSAHGVPVSLVKEGDPYKLQIEETVRLVMERGAYTSPHLLCYQSKVGPAEWLKPSLHATLRALATQGRKHLLVVPIAFVTEHIETLHEINIEAREEAMQLGVEQFEMMPALDDHPRFIKCLADLVVRKLTASTTGLPSCRERFDKRGVTIPPVVCPHWSTQSTP
jgi:ferrochelatase